MAACACFCIGTFMENIRYGGFTYTTRPWLFICAVLCVLELPDSPTDDFMYIGESEENHLIEQAFWLTDTEGAQPFY